MGTLRPSFDLKGTLPARRIEAFLLVALDEGLSVGGYARRAGISMSTSVTICSILATATDKGL